MVKNLPANAGDLRVEDLILRSGRPPGEGLLLLSHFSRVRLCDPMDCSPPGSSVHGILQARILGWVAMTSPGDLPNPGIEPESLTSPALAGRFFTTRATWEAHKKSRKC